MAETTIEVQKLQEMLAQGRPVTVLDVRHGSDYQDWSVAGSVHIDAYDALKAMAAEAMDGVNLPENKPIITI
jgi:rhodanese-related sulfurtransferase